MDIADVTLFHAPNSGGVKTYLEAKRRRLARYADIRHFLVKPGETALSLANTVRVPALPLPFSDGYRFPLRRQGFVRALMQIAPDIIEAGDPYLPAWAALQAGRRLGVPVVGFYHSDVVRLFSNRLGPAVTPALKLYVRLLYRQFDLVLAPSRVMARQLERCGIPDVKVQPLGVDLERFNPCHASPSLRRELGLDEHTRLLVFAGRGSREKNLPVLLETLRNLGPAYHLLLVGSNMPRRVPSNVSVINHFCSPDTVARILASADALVHAGDQETFGLVILEAMASGTPVVVVKAGALPELVPDDCGCLARANDPADMARAVRALFRRGSTELGANARRFVEQQHDWDVVIANLMLQYRQLVGLRIPAQLGWTHG